MFKKKRYDSTRDTLDHIQSVQRKIGAIVVELLQRSLDHDRSKLDDPEKTVFDVYTPLLRGVTYGSDEYKKFLQDMQPALQHHYRHNRHHPEYFDHHCHTGYSGVAAIYHMNLVDLVEMFCDWAAAVERHEDGDLMKSIRINQERFHLDEQIVALFENTIGLLTPTTEQGGE